MYDVIIIGTGPAGLSAALYILRANLSVLIVGKDDGALGKAHKVENYFGVSGAPAGSDLIETGKEQVVSLGGQLINEEVLDIIGSGDFVVKTNKGEYSARAVILATGAARKTLNIPGVSEFDGKGVSYCAVCDAFFYRNKDVAVIGNGDYALHELEVLLPVAHSVAVLTNGHEVEAEFPENVRVIECRVSEIYGIGRVSGIKLQNGAKIEVSGVFIALGSASAADLAKKMGAVVADNRIEVNESMETTLPGMFAAGDCTGGVQQMSVAVGEGAKAALSAIKYLRG